MRPKRSSPAAIAASTLSGSRTSRATARARSGCASCTSATVSGLRAVAITRPWLAAIASTTPRPIPVELPTTNQVSSVPMNLLLTGRREAPVADFPQST